MQPNDASHVLRKVSDFFQRTFPVVRLKNIGVDDALFDRGVLDSMGMIDVILFMQREFSIAVDGNDLVADNFRTMRAISAFVEKQIARG